jgi:adenylate cyclase
MSVEQFAKTLPADQSSQFANLIASSTTNDEVFASALRSTKTVLSTALSWETKADGIPGDRGFGFVGPDPGVYLYGAPARIRNLPLLESSATAIGCISIFPDRDGITRRIPLLYKVGERHVPSLALELIRLAINDPDSWTVVGDEAGVRWLALRRIRITADANANIYVRLNRSRPELYIPAWKVLSGEISQEDVKGRIILVSPTAAGLSVGQASAIGQIHQAEFLAQAIEGILSHSNLERPFFGPLLELVIVVLLGIALALVLPGRSPIVFIGINLIVGFSLLAGGWLAYTKLSMLFDVAYPVAFVLFISFVIVVFLYMSMEVRRRNMKANLKAPEARKLIPPLAPAP